jgi:hypothetical protein
MTQWYLVWIEGLRGPEPQKWSQEAFWGALSRQDILVRIALSEREAELPIEQLARLHPAPRD